MSRAQQSILRMVGTIRHRWLRRQLIGFAAVGLAALLGWLLVMIALDNLAMLSRAQLALGWVVLAAGVAGWVFFFGNRIWLGRPSAASLALLYEQRLLGRENRLINAVQFLESRLAQRDPIACAAVIENASVLDPRTAPRAVDFRPARNALIGLGICAGLLAGYGGLRPQWAANGLARLFHPLSPPTHLLATEPVVTPGDIELVEGSPLTIEARVPNPARPRTTSIWSTVWPGWIGSAAPCAESMKTASVATSTPSDIRWPIAYEPDIRSARRTRWRCNIAHASSSYSSASGNPSTPGAGRASSSRTWATSWLSKARPSS
jgi:hypothetical protein